MNKFFIFFMTTMIITSCVPNKKILTPEQLMQDKIQAEKILGRWDLFIGGSLVKTNFYKNNTSLWQTINRNTYTFTDNLIKMDFNWKIENSKIILNLTEINIVHSYTLGRYIVLTIHEFSNDRIILKDQNGNEAIMIQN